MGGKAETSSFTPSPSAGTTSILDLQRRARQSVTAQMLVNGDSPACSSLACKRTADLIQARQSLKPKQLHVERCPLPDRGNYVCTLHGVAASGRLVGIWMIRIWHRMRHYTKLLLQAYLGQL